MKYALSFGKTAYVKRMNNLLLSQAFEDGVVDLTFEFVLEGVPHTLLLYDAERVHPGVAGRVEEYSPEVWEALCVVFDREVEEHVRDLLEAAHVAGKTTWEIFGGCVDDGVPLAGVSGHGEVGD